MAKKDDVVEQEPIDPFVGGEEDDLSDMEYIQDETTTTKVETHPPETDEEAELMAEQAKAEAEAEGETDDELSEEGKADVEAEAEPVEEEETAQAEAEDDVDADPKVPHSRFKEVNDRMKAAEDKVRELQKQLEEVIETKNTPPEPEPEPFDFATKEQAAADALLEGDNEKYAQLRAEIREAERQDFLREAKKLASEGDSKLRETMTFEEVGAKVEADYPQFVEGSEEFNAAAYDELMDLYVGFAKSGKYDRAEALQRAADRAAKLHDLTATSAEPEPAPKDNDKVVNIKKANVQDKAKAAESQPPVMESGDSAREEHSSIAVQSMSDKQFEALPESTKRRLRGDIL